MSPRPTAADPHEAAPLARLGLVALAAAALGLALSVAALLIDPAAWLHGYVLALHLALAPTLGALILLLVHVSVESRWGLVLRRILLAAIAPLPLLAALTLPLLLVPLWRSGLVYPWSDPATVAASEVLRQKTAWLNPTGFALRGAFYLLVWNGLALYWRRLLARPDARSLSRLVAIARGPAAASLIALALTVAAASVDWAMSLEPEWYSSMYPLIFLAGDALTAMAFSYAVALWLARAGGSMATALTVGRSRDLANLLLTCVILFAYVAFFQYLVAWQGDTRSEVTWYVHRRSGGWQLLVGALAIFQLALPLAVLLFRELKRHVRPMLALCILILGMRGVDLYWTLMPAFHPSGVHLSWTTPASLFLVGGAWFFAFVRSLRAAPAALPEAVAAATAEPTDRPIAPPRVTPANEVRHAPTR